LPSALGSKDSSVVQIFKHSTFDWQLWSLCLVKILNL